ncbi:N-acetylneuraminate synthase family protein [Fusibacter sp. 3D3]|uniref:N-acetylneuraminate synthase family protein n=1 Tax=Fusibacter sp. 3D3 TaxID=1048380 RepID=UPI000857046B|nr:N-acetylneuraminate synthase family protein [Fusibacter sp. 3D3]GAU77772.1 N-acetylneuraminate synthase [Fusibacter sp. 3D3]
MKIVFGSVIYKQKIEYINAFIQSLNDQDYDTFDVLLLNDDLQLEEIEYICQGIKKNVILEEFCKDLKPYELRQELIKLSYIKGYDLLIMGDFDDAFSRNRVSAILEGYDEECGFFYNKLVILGSDEPYFSFFQKETNSINDILNGNYLGLSNCAINLNLLNDKILKDISKCNTSIFDWALFSVLLLSSLRGKYIENTHTLYRFHSNNIIGSLVGQNQKMIEKEIDIKIIHYEILKRIEPDFIRYFHYYMNLKELIKNRPERLFYFLKDDKNKWWNKLEYKEDGVSGMVNINGYLIENYNKPYVIAEIGANHNGDMELARKLIDAAKKTGAHAVKFQSWTEKSLVSRTEYDSNQKYDDSPKKHFGSLEEMVSKYYLREEQHFMLKNYCDEIGIDFCSTPFSEEEVDLLEKLDVPFYKVASMDINNYRLLRYIAKKNKPVFLSTGMSTIYEIDKAIKIIEEENNNQIVILHCISIYPPDPKDIHLNNIKMLQQLYPMYPIGFSDHTIGTSVPVASVALGSAVIEKHFTIDKQMEGWDHEISADPIELKYIVDESKIIADALGNYNRTVSKAEENKKSKFRRSIVMNKNMKAGEIIGEKDIAFKRPGTHISPENEAYIVGRKLKKDMAYDDLLSWGDME